jgi:hypothetical protein
MLFASVENTDNNDMDYPSQGPCISLGKAVECHASLYSLTGGDGAHQKALFSHLSAIARRPVQTAYPLHVTPYWGKCGDHASSPSR